jgi:hypothetical protein
LNLWKAQTERIVGKNGLVSFIVHPDYIIEKRARGIYRDLLNYLRRASKQTKLWFAVAGEIDRWWRARSQMRLVDDNGTWNIEGSGAERAKLAFATVVGDHLEYEIES